MEDLIDFPCSADWLDFYHKQGLTPRSSGRPSRVEIELFKQIEKLNKRVDLQEQILIELFKQLKKPNNDKKPKSGFDLKEE